MKLEAKFPEKMEQFDVKLQGKLLMALTHKTVRLDTQCIDKKTAANKKPSV